MNSAQVAAALRGNILPNATLTAPYQWGYVASVDSVNHTVDLYLDGTHTLGDTAYLTPGLRYVNWYLPSVGDYVIVLRNTGASRSDRVVLGPLAPSGLVAPPTGSAGGDLGGTYPDPGVVGIQGIPVSSTTPTTGEVLVYNGTDYVPGTPSGTPTGSAGGDLAGTYPDPTVAKLQTIPVATTAPTSGQVLEYNGTAWTPTTIATGGGIVSIGGAGVDVVGDALYTLGVGPSGLGVRNNGDWSYDSSTKISLLFGGYDTGALNDTWSWNGTFWTHLSPTASPSPRAAAKTCQTQSGTIILFGGYLPPSTSYNDTWSWNGTDWTQLSPTTSPPVRAYHHMFYISSSSTLFLFGGIDEGPGTLYNDTWSWNGTDWTQLSPSTSPPGRYGGGAVYDSSSGTGLLFGGFNGSNYLNDTWSWNGTDWTQLSPTTSPPVRAFPAMFYDPTSGTIILFGGNGSTGAPLNDTWSWNGTDWTQLSPSTSPSARAYMYYDWNPDLNLGLILGGYNGSNTLGDMWSWDGTTWASVTQGEVVDRNTLDDGSGNASVQGTLTAAHVDATPTLPALPANPPVSGTVYQNTTGGPIKISLGISATVAGTAQWALGSSSSPSDWGPATTTLVGSVIDKNIEVPNNWYWSLTVTGTATITTASVLGG